MFNYHAKCISGIRLMLGFALLLLAVSSALAQEPKTDVNASDQDLHDVLKTINASGGVCHKDDISIPSTDLREHQANTLDMSCSVSAKEAALLLEKPGSSLIDLRSSAEYLAWHVPNSLNITLTEVLTKAYLRNKLLVLMGSGKLESESLYACMRLKQEGFGRVFVVRGGILGWMQHGYATQGNSPNVSDALKMRSEELWAASQFVENRIFLDVGRESMRSLLPNATLLKANAIETLRSAANRAGNNKIKSVIGLILVTSPEISENRIRELQKAVLPTPLLIYPGTEVEYRAFANQQKAVLSAHVRGPKKLGCGL